MKLAWGLERPKPTWIKTKSQMEELIRICSKKDILALDTETTGKRIDIDRVIFWSLSTGNDRYFLEADKLRDFRPVFQDPDKYWIGSQIKYDFHMCANSGEDIAGGMMCTLTMDRLVDPDQEHGLKEAYEREFNEKMRSFGETFYPKNKRGQFRKPPKRTMQDIILEGWERDPERVIDYASLDAWGVFRLFKRLKKYLKRVKTCKGYTLWQLFLAYEVPMSRVLYEMERTGCQLDLDYLGEIGPKLTGQLVKINKKLNRMIGQPINPGSTKQLAGLFYGDMGLEPIAWTSGGASGKKSPSLNAAVMEAHAAEGVPEAELILKYREMDKILGTYVTGLVDRADKFGRIHTTFNQHVADTGRLSSSAPNLQNIPRPRKAFDIRKAFIPPPGKKLIVCDYDQLEMYILGHYSQDKGLLNNIRIGRDIHTGNVELVWGEPYDEVAAAKKNKEDKSERADYLRKLRNDVKVVGFGQPNLGRSKTHSKRGNPSGAIPCCVARRSVSTCGVSA